MENNIYITCSDLKRCFGASRIVLDCETTGLLWFQNHIIGLGVYCPDAGVRGYIPTLDAESREEVYDTVHQIPPETWVIGHNLKFDLHFLWSIPDEMGWNPMDTMILAHLIDSRYRKSMDWLEVNLLGTASKREYLATPPSKIKKKVWLWPTDLTAQYCVNDTEVTYQFAETFTPIVRDLGLWELFLKDMRYMSEIMRVENRGVHLDMEFVENASKYLVQHRSELEQALYDSCGQTFNYRSPQQLSKAIYQGLGIEKPKNPFADADGVDRSRFADAGKYKSTCTSTFILTEKINHPLGGLIQAIREDDKLLRNYLTRWPTLTDENFNLHANYNITGTRTGRLSSSKPNLQNVPAEARGRFTQSVYTGSVLREEWYNLRRAIVARPGHVYLSTDFKQMEMRMFGIISKDPFMLEYLTSGQDVHLQIALKVWGNCGDELNRIHREWSKTISFGLIYGMTLGSLQYKLNMTRMEARQVTEQYWAQFPRIKPWLNEVVESCKRDGYLRYWSGRYWREDNPLDMYKGANALIQGGCADLISIAIMRIGEWIRAEARDNHLINIVHDETILEVPMGDVLRTARKVAKIMEVPDLFDLPFITDTKLGLNYGEEFKIPKELLWNEATTNDDILALLPKATGPVIDEDKFAGFQSTEEEGILEEVEEEGKPENIAQDNELIIPASI